MSSHHIIRDCQEPALWIAGDNTCSFELIHQLLGWSPWLIVEAAAVEQVIDWGIKIDALLVPTTEIMHFDTVILNQNPVQVVDYPMNMLDAGLLHLTDKSIDAIHMCTTPKVAQETQAKFPDYDWVFFYDNYKMTFQKQSYWRKWVAIEQKFILEGAQLEVVNLRKDSTNPNHYTATQEGFVEISSKKNGFWVYEQLD